MDNSLVKTTILAVDDTPANLDVVKGILSDEYLVQAAINGKMALKIIEKKKPDLILLDIMMPEMDGYEVCKRVKENESFKDIPIIFLTAKTEVEDEIKGLGQGAVDYITKPISAPILKARVKTHLALREANRKLDAHNQQLVHEREIIENIIVKMRDADTFDDRNLRHLISPVEVTAGDILLSVFTPDGRQLVLLGDFTGHGLTAAIGGPLITYILHTYANNNATGAEILQEINTQLCARLPIGLFFAAIMIEVMEDKKRANLYNSAMAEVLQFTDGEIKERYSSTMLPLGVAKDLDIASKNSVVPLQSGDRLIAFSDGIIEASNKNESMFGMERLEQFLAKSIKENIPLIDLLPILNKYVDSSDHDDDITLVEVTV
ncbi:MAG: SpoIIE family protein phosphatase [Magnetococcales bacterium]|nr:SpoIIE family protein phosphatase [Magnetococcales bacterium]